MAVKKEINQRIGANIKAVREESRYTQERLSELLSITPNHLSAIERGYYGASPELIDKLCSIFAVSADRFFFGLSKPDDSTLTLLQRLKTLPPNQKSQIQQLIFALLDLLESK